MFPLPQSPGDKQCLNVGASFHLTGSFTRWTMARLVGLALAFARIAVTRRFMSQVSPAFHFCCWIAAESV